MLYFRYFVIYILFSFPFSTTRTIKLIYILQSVHLHILSQHVPSYPLSSHIEDSQAYSVNKRCLSISLNSSHVSFLLRQFVLLDSFLYQIATYPPDPSNLLLPYGDDHQPIINIISISARSICIMCFFLALFMWRLRHTFCIILFRYVSNNALSIDLFTNNIIL